MGLHVDQSYTDTGQSSDLSGLVGSRRAILGSDRFPSEPCFDTTGPDKARWVARLSHIDAHLMYGTIRDPPHGTCGGSSGPDGPTVRQGHCQTPFNRSLPGLGGRHSYWCQPVYLSPHTTAIGCVTSCLQLVCVTQPGPGHGTVMQAS